ncbi:MAG TPA: hypothetical protein VHT52_13055 [Stellaceae bacterium]|nr:hypothetical protein [Stellaceae bacterium]
MANGDPIEVEVGTVRERLMRRIARIAAARTSGGVPETLKDRKGRTLSHDDLAHYKKIVAALSETIRLMQEVDEVIEQYGGWPGAFAEPKEKAMVTDQVALIDKSHVSARPN